MTEVGKMYVKTKMYVHLQRNVPLTDLNVHLQIFTYTANKVKFIELNVHLQRCMYTSKVYVPL